MSDTLIQDLNDVLTSDDETENVSPTVKSESLKAVLPLKRKEFEDEKEFNRFVKSVERLVRSSPEYREFINFTRESLNADVCSFTGETEDESGDVEIHHYPLTLFDIVRGVIDDFIFKDQEFSSFDITSEVIKLHFQLNIGFVPLIGTLHKKFHKGNLEIPIEYVLGNYEFLANSTNLDPELKNKLESAKRLTTNTVQQIQWRPKIVGNVSNTIDENQSINKQIEKKAKEIQDDIKDVEEPKSGNIMSSINLEELVKS